MTKSQRIAIVCLLACFVLQGIGLFAMIAVSAWSRGTKLLDGGTSERALGYSTDALQMPALLCIVCFFLSALMMCASPIWTFKKVGAGAPGTAEMFRFILPFLGFIMGCILMSNVCGLYAGYQYALIYERSFSFVLYEDRARIAISSYIVTFFFLQAILLIWLMTINLKVAFTKKHQEANTNIIA